MVHLVMVGLDAVAETPMPDFARTQRSMTGLDWLAQMMPAVVAPMTVHRRMKALELAERMMPVLELLRISLSSMTGHALSSHAMPLEQRVMRLFRIFTVVSTPTSTMPLNVALSMSQPRTVMGPVARRMICSRRSAQPSSRESLVTGVSARSPRRAWTPISAWRKMTFSTRPPAMLPT